MTQGQTHRRVRLQGTVNELNFKKNDLNIGYRETFLGDAVRIKTSSNVQTAIIATQADVANATAVAQRNRRDV